LQASGQLERLLRSGVRFAAKALMLSTAAGDGAIKIAVRRIGPTMVRSIAPPSDVSRPPSNVAVIFLGNRWEMRTADS
jgi:hypothetical protein